MPQKYLIVVHAPVNGNATINLYYIKPISSLQNVLVKDGFERLVSLIKFGISSGELFSIRSWSWVIYRGVHWINIDVHCPLCGSLLEDTAHILFNCDVPKCYLRACGFEPESFNSANWSSSSIMTVFLHSLVNESGDLVAAFAANME